MMWIDSRLGLTVDDIADSPRAILTSTGAIAEPVLEIFEETA
jgi:hypothetical protein